MDETLISKLIIDTKLGQAEETFWDLKLDHTRKLNILELGCGIGCLSKIIKDHGHNIVSCDNLEYRPRNFEKKYNIEYKKVLENFGFPRQHFYYQIPHTDENVKKNNEMFAKLRSYNKQKYDLIIWQAFDLFQESEMGIEETIYLVKNLMKLMTEKGQIIIGYNGTKAHAEDKTLQSSKAYRWLAKWRTEKHPEMGHYRWVITNGHKNSTQGLMWSYILHCVPDGPYQPELLDKFFNSRASRTANYLGLDRIKSKKILEIGCGLGHFSKHLARLHEVSSVDDKEFHLQDENYQKYLKHVNWPREHFRYKLPYVKFKKYNIQAIKNLSTHGKKFDYILWQNSCLLDNTNITTLCVRSLLDNLKQHLNPDGKIIIGFDSKSAMGKNLSKYSDFLGSLLMDNGSTPMGETTICVTKS